MNHSGSALLCLLAILNGGCGGHHAKVREGTSGDNGSEQGVVNLFVWSDYLASDTINSFEKLTGLKVNATYFDTNETLETRMLTGHSGFDVVAPSGAYFQRQIRSGAYLPLNRALLPNLASFDPTLTASAARYDPGNVYGVVHTWGTFGIGYNEKALSAILPRALLNDWRLVFDPSIAKQLASCGINILDNSAAVVHLMLIYLGRNPNNPAPRDLADAGIALGYNGDIVQARNRAREANNGISIAYTIPDEGSLLWLTMLAIPRDAPHVANAHRLMNYLMDPQVLAHTTQLTGFANANLAALPLIDASIAQDQAIYPTASQLRRVMVQSEDSPEQARAITRIWQKFKTGQ